MTHTNQAENTSAAETAPIDTTGMQYLRCPHCTGPLYVAATVKHWGMRLRRDGTCDLQERGAEYDIDHDSAYCGTCETEFESISALVAAAEGMTP